MVRKRTRRPKSSDEDEDSDVALSTLVDRTTEEEEEDAEPAPKKYSLRERKRTSTVIPDFDYGTDDDEASSRGSRADDDDFEAEPEEPDDDDEDFYIEEQRGPRAPRRRSNNKGAVSNGRVVVEEPKVVETFTEPPKDNSNNGYDENGMIDFEDMIRADVVVVNRKTIDYDSIIKRSAIKVNPPVVSRKSSESPQDSSELDALSLLQPEISLHEGQGDINDSSNKSVQPIETVTLSEAQDDGLIDESPVVTEKVDKVIDLEVEDDDVILLEPKQDVIVLDD